MRQPIQDVGSEDLEEGMRPSPAIRFAQVAAIVVAIALAFNSAALLDWTRQAQAGPVIAACEGPAAVWHGWMERLGTATAFARARRAVQSLIVP